MMENKKGGFQMVSQITFVTLAAAALTALLFGDDLFAMLPLKMREMMFQTGILSRELNEDLSCPKKAGKANQMTVAKSPV